MKKAVIFSCLLLCLGVFFLYVHTPYAQTNEKTPLSTALPGYQPSASAQVKLLIMEKVQGRTFKDGHKKIHQNGLSCQLCHYAEAPSTAPDDRNCIRCHGSMEDVAKLTEKLRFNPHASVHYGSDISCITCHKEHKPSVLLCADCHILSYEKFK